MNFLFPAMLAGLVGLAVPLVLHLIARHRFPVQDFPSIRFLVREKHTNVFAPKLVDPLQLLLRLLVILLLVLAMSRLFVDSPAKRPAPHNLVVVVDCSDSMRMRVPPPSEGGSGEEISVVTADGNEDDSKIPIIDQAKRAAAKLFSRIEAPSQCALVTAEQQAVLRYPLGPSADAALAALDDVKATDGTGQGLLQAVAAAFKLVENRREVKSRIIVLTDMRETAFAARGARELETIRRIRQRHGDKIELVFVDLSGQAMNNLSIESATVRGAPKVGDDTHVKATIVNRGTTAQTTKVGLTFGGKKEPASREIRLEPGGRAVLDLTLRMNRAVRSYVDVNIDEDNYASDDRFSVPLNVIDSRRVLIVNGLREEVSPDLTTIGKLGADGTEPIDDERIDGAKILRFVLNPPRELGLAYGTGIHTTVVTPDALAAQPLSRFELIILYDVSSLSEPVLRDLDNFVRQGRALLIVASKDTNAVKFNESLAVGHAARLPNELEKNARRPRAPGDALSPTRLGNDRQIESAVGIDLADLRHPVLRPFGDRLEGDISVIRFTQLRDLLSVSDDAAVFMKTTTGEPLAVEKPLGRGRVVLLTFGFELERGNIALTRAFPPFMWRLVDYLNGDLRRRPPDVVPALSPAVLDVSEPEFAFTPQLELVRIEDQVADAGAAPAETVYPVSVRDDQTVVTPSLDAGRYRLRKKQDALGVATLAGYSRIIFSRPDPREGVMTKLGDVEMRELFGTETQLISDDEQLSEPPSGRELWKLVVGLLILAYFLEAVIGYLLNVRREKRRTMELT